MVHQPHVDWRFVVVTLALIIVIWIMGPDIGVMVALLVWVDFAVAPVAIIRGFRTGSHGRIVGGALCGLMALSLAPAVDTPTATGLQM